LRQREKLSLPLWHSDGRNRPWIRPEIDQTAGANASLTIVVPASPEHDAEKWGPVSRLRKALARLVVWLEASAGEARSENIMLQK
jgi:hypothetical protein